MRFRQDMTKIQNLLANILSCVMSCLKVICWALIFIFKLRIPHGISIATVSKGLYIALRKYLKRYVNSNFQCFQII